MKLTMPLLLALMSVSMAIPACAHYQPVINAGEFCATDAAQKEIKEILPKAFDIAGCAVADVSKLPACALAGFDSLAAQYGMDVLSCALQQLANGKFVKAGDTFTGVRQERAKAYLELKGKPVSMRGRGVAPRMAHNHQVASSSLAPATPAAG